MSETWLIYKILSQRLPFKGNLANYKILAFEIWYSSTGNHCFRFHLLNLLVTVLYFYSPILLVASAGTKYVHTYKFCQHLDYISMLMKANFKDKER